MVSRLNKCPVANHMSHQYYNVVICRGFCGHRELGDMESCEERGCRMGGDMGGGGLYMRREVIHFSI